MRPKLILCFDGGGTKSGFYVRFVSHLEKALGKKLSNVADMVVGVSAGAVAAAVVANIQYEDVGQVMRDTRRIFREPQESGPFMDTKYDGTGKTAFMADTFGVRRMGDASLPLCVLTSTINGESAVFTSWEHKSTSLARVIDASTAAPTYFPPVQIGDRYYMDGGVVSNDPALVGVYKARELWGEHIPLAVMSIGTGSATDIQVSGSNPTAFGLVKWLSEGLVDVLTRSNEQLYRQIIPLIIGKGHYLRITTRVVARLDNESAALEAALNADADRAWILHSEQLLHWMSTHLLLSRPE
jgi:predicted patatin/cPLA2 family phospholipase